MTRQEVRTFGEDQGSQDRGAGVLFPRVRFEATISFSYYDDKFLINILRVLSEVCNMFCVSNPHDFL